MAYVHPMRIEKDILEIAELKSRQEHTSKTTALKQFLYSGVEEYVLKLCSQGRISIGKAAELLQKSVSEVQQNAKEKGIELGLTIEQYASRKKTVEMLRKKI